MEALIVALVTGGFSVLAVVITVRASSNKMQADLQADLAKHEAVTEEKIDNLTKQVEKHNGVIERTFKLEQKASNLFHRFEETKQVADEAHSKAFHACERADAAHNRMDRAGIDTN